MDEIGAVELETLVNQANGELSEIKSNMIGAVNESEDIGNAPITEETGMSVEGRPRVSRTTIRNGSITRAKHENLTGTVRKIDQKVKALDETLSKLTKAVREGKGRSAVRNLQTKGVIAMSGYPKTLNANEDTNVELKPQQGNRVNVFELQAYSHDVTCTKINYSGNPAISGIDTIIVPAGKKERFIMNEPVELSAATGLTFTARAGAGCNVSVRAWFDPNPFEALRIQN